jgi:hypothetical protein
VARFSAAEYSQALRLLVKVPSQISAKVADRIKKEILKGFTSGKDPYGGAWAPLRPATLAKGRTPPPLTDTGKGKRSIKVSPVSGAGVQVTVGKAYMKYHMTGTPIMVPRRFLPVNSLPKAWRKIWQEELTKAARKKLNAK